MDDFASHPRPPRGGLRSLIPAARRGSGKREVALIAAHSPERATRGRPSKHHACYDRLPGLGAPKLIVATAILAAVIFGAAPTHAYPPNYNSVLTYGIAPESSSAAEGSHVFCTTQCSVWSLEVTSGGAAGYVMTFNATAVPADGAVTPVTCVVLPATSTVSISYESGPSEYMNTGYVAVFSTTGCFTKTASATAFFKARITR